MTRGPEDFLRDTPYLVPTERAAQERFQRIQARSTDIQRRSLDVAAKVDREAAGVIRVFDERRRSNLVAESNRIEGYDWTPEQVQEVVTANRTLLDATARNFIDGVRKDSRTLEALGLYRAYELADEWAASQLRPKEFEIRALHQLIVPDEPFAGQYKSVDNTISGSTHETVSPLETPKAMRELADWFEHGSGDPVLDATVIHAWLTHIHPFDDGNGRLARLLANLALVQHGYPPLSIQSDSKGPYFDALEASDEGDILPLYALLVNSLRRTVKRMERPGYVSGLITDHLFTNPPMLEALWAGRVTAFLKRLKWKAQAMGWFVEEIGLPSHEQFELLLDGDSDGNCWLALLEPAQGEPEVLLWFGFRSRRLRELLPEERLLPSIFFSRRDRRPDAPHRFRYITEGEGPVEVALYPDDRDQPALLRYASEMTDVTDGNGAAEAIATAYCSKQ